MTKRGLKSRPSSPSYGGGSARNLELVGKSSEDVRSSTRLRLKPLRKPKSSHKQKKKKAAKLHGKIPKKPPTAFFFFLYVSDSDMISCYCFLSRGSSSTFCHFSEDFRKLYQEENPEVKSMREEKVKYYDIATEKREEFHRAMTEYTKRVESGEFDESETESDFSE
ncbi:hypothetical protein DY000_02035229 [Brassica cretica]|uniref:HMG box domain-containing protein n=1 Tax=Brassica cretica TaxID=69181 RepID=A0ABQ7DYI3_BRACR|nr:hypothetical protein DY000_02035229 [Brassica cretica]